MNVKHRKRNTRLYRIWLQMKNRCYNKRSERYKDYGARGIVMCDDWKDNFQTFYDWAISHGYSDELTIDRIDNNGNYEPSNCRWVSVKEQNRNSRHNRLLTFNGETHCISEWSEIIGINRECIVNRLNYGWTIEDALTKPKGYNQGISKDGNVHNTKRVVCIETQQIYENSKSVERTLHIDASSVRKCCKGKQLTAGGFHWKYFEEEEQ